MQGGEMTVGAPATAKTPESREIGLECSHETPTPKSPMQGGEMTVGTPATAKNILAVGATDNTVVRPKP